MRPTITALAAFTLMACAADKAPPQERLTFERIERAFENTVATSPVRAAQGNVFVIVHLIEDPAPEEGRDWIRSVMEDWDGRVYRAQFAGASDRRSVRTGLFGRQIETVHPVRIQVVFEVPRTSVLRRVTVPHPISLFETPARIFDPRSAPRIVRRVEPHYPEAARRHGVDGLVKLEVLVLPDGTVAGARPIHGPSVLGKAAAAAVRQWQYEPLVINGRAVPALIEVHINFRAGP